MHPLDATSFLSDAPAAEGSFELQPRRQQLGGAASSSPSPRRRRGARAGGERGGARCQGCWRRQGSPELLVPGGRAKACRRAHPHRRCGQCFVCPAHAKTPRPHVPASQASERQQMLATLAASTAEAESIHKRPRPRSPASAATTSSVDLPVAMVPERFEREVSLDAVFRRVRLGPEAEVAYYSTVTIAGHVFRGILYDVGPHSRESAASDTDGSGDAGSSLSTAAGGGGGCLDLTLRL